MDKQQLGDLSIKADDELKDALEAWNKAPQWSKQASRTEVLEAYKLVKLLDDAVNACYAHEKHALVTAVLED